MLLIKGQLNLSNNFLELKNNMLIQKNQIFKKVQWVSMLIFLLKLTEMI
jgi:hypothetical protein